MIVNSNTYEEIYQILSCMDKLIVMKIPENILNDIALKRNISYVTKIDKKDIFNRINMSDEAFYYMCWLDFKFWMSEEKKKEFKEECKCRLIKDEEKKIAKYNPKNNSKNKEMVLAK